MEGCKTNFGSNFSKTPIEFQHELFFKNRGCVARIRHNEKGETFSD